MPGIYVTDLQLRTFRRTPKHAAFSATICAIAIASFQNEAIAASDINSGSTYLASNLGTSVNPDFKGGTLELDTASTITNNFTVESDSTNTIDAFGHAATLSGAFTGAGPLTFTDSVGGGNATLSSSANTFSGATTINSGALLTLSGSGTIATSSSLTDNGTFDISPTTSGASIISLAGTGGVTLGTQSLTLTVGAGTFSGTISGAGGLNLTSGTEILAGANSYTGVTTITAGTLEIGSGGTSGSLAGNVANSGTLTFDRIDASSFGGAISGTGTVIQLGSGSTTLTGTSSYTGVTTISAGTLALSGTGSIAASSNVAATGTFDISATSAGASIRSLSGAGTVQLGGQTLTLTAATGTFSGVVAGSGGVTVNGGTELLSGANTYSGATIVNAGTLELSAGAIANNISTIGTGTLAFDSATAITMNGIVSGSGGVAQTGAGTTTISTPQTYTGPTTISVGTLSLSGNGSLAASSVVTATGTLDVSGTTGTSIISLAGTGAVKLGTATLTLTGASGSFSGILSGTGGLTLAGGGETLFGVDTFTGVTTISGGTLYLSGSNSLATSSAVIDNAALDISGVITNGNTPGATIISLGGSGSVVLGSRVLTLSNASNTFSGTISGSGGLTVAGGTQILSGANSYIGTTTISAGSLALSGAGSLAATGVVEDDGVFDISATNGTTVTIASLSGSGTVNLGARTLNFANASSAYSGFSGTIFGTGGLLVSGGTQILSGTNSYSGGTLVSAGTLQIGGGAFSGTIVGNVTDNATLAFDRFDTATFSGIISGTGAVNQIGSGTTVLTAANTYTGGTIITAGTLQIGNGSAAGSIMGDVADNGTLAFGRSDATIFNGTISGSGGVTQVNGTTTLTAVNSYTGATLIDNGANLILSSSASIAASGTVTDNGVLDVSAVAAGPQIASLAGAGTVTLGGQNLTLTNGAGNFAGALSGVGGLVLSGGSQTLSGTNSYAGATTINGGTLVVNGSIASSSGVTVNSGGTLAGAGTVAATNVASGGTVAPGTGGTGTLTVNGPIAFASGSNFVIHVSSAGAPALVTNGSASLAGTLSVASLDGSYPLGQKLTVLTAAGGVSGSFANPQISATGAQFSSAVSYDADDVYLQINLAKLSPLLPSGATRNETDVVDSVDAAIAAGDSLPVRIADLGTVSSATLASDADQLAGEIGADVPQAGEALFDPFMNAIFDHINDGQSAASRLTGPRETIWASAFTGSNLISSDAGNADLHPLRSNAEGIAGGADWRLSPRLMLGAALSGGAANFHIADSFGTGKANGFQAAVYGQVQFNSRVYGSFAGIIARDAVTTNRTLTVSGTDDLTGKSTIGVYGARYESGWKLGWVTPYVAFQDRLIQAPSYDEAAASGSNAFALHYADNSNNVADVELGLHQLGQMPLTRSWTLQLSDGLAWEHDISGGAETKAAFAATPASDFTIYGVQAGKDVGHISLGAGLKSKSGLGLNVHFDGAISANSQTYEEFAGLNFAW